MEPADSPDCALSKAKWDTEKERTARSGKQIRKVSGAAVLARIDKDYPDIKEFKPEDITAFSLDLDNDGKDEIIFHADNGERLSMLHEKAQTKFKYVSMGGILSGDTRSKHPKHFSGRAAKQRS